MLCSKLVFTTSVSPMIGRVQCSAVDSTLFSARRSAFVYVCTRTYSYVDVCSADVAFSMGKNLHLFCVCLLCLLRALKRTTTTYIHRPVHACLFTSNSGSSKHVEEEASQRKNAPLQSHSASLRDVQRGAFFWTAFSPFYSDVLLSFFTDWTNFFSRWLLREERGRSEAESPMDIVRTGSWEGII